MAMLGTPNARLDPLHILHERGQRVVTRPRPLRPAAAALVEVDHTKRGLEPWAGERCEAVAVVAGPAVQEDDGRHLRRARPATRYQTRTPLTTTLCSPASRASGAASGVAGALVAGPQPITTAPPRLPRRG